MDLMALFDEGVNLIELEVAAVSEIVKAAVDVFLYLDSFGVARFGHIRIFCLEAHKIKREQAKS